MIGRPAGWNLYIGHMRAVLDLSEHVWVSIRSELESAGYYSQTRSRDAAGKIVWLREVSDTPAPPPSPKPSRMDTTMHGVAMHGGVGDIALSKNHDHAACTAPAAVAPPGGGKRRRTRPSGIDTWDADDEAEAIRIEATYPADDIAAACRAISARRNAKGNPTSPVPGLVAAELARKPPEYERPPEKIVKATKNGWQKTKADIDRLGI
jgi:hypothetical protein